MSAAAEQSRPVIRLDGLRKSFGALEIIRGVELDVQAGERHALIGPNGAGKSTLVGLISGLLRPSGGRVLLNGRRIDGLSPERINRLGLARSFQITRIFPRLSVMENLRLGIMARHGIRFGAFRLADSYEAVARETREMLATIRLGGRADAPAGELTYSEQRALELGLALTTAPEVILLDEPTAGMSRDEADHVVALIRDVTRDRTLLIIEHDMDVVFRLCDRVSVLVYGQIIASGTPEAIRADARVQEAYLGSEVAA
ncbi:ABC transporter ATP-binding protein [Marinibaculum pumilum]|uniref:ABC transporter ATP-binding protein n=1 Tax=Marinibaculum pumilum TaxID=1766165 RepID=A0ABV7L5V6_9PROT